MGIIMPMNTPSTTIYIDPFSSTNTVTGTVTHETITNNNKHNHPINMLTMIKTLPRKILQSLSCSGYKTLLTTNRHYRLYLCSHICQNAGDRFVLVADLLTVERLAPNSAKALSILVLTRTIPDAIITPFGGMLADTYDRRRVMITLDAIGSLAIVGYVIALRCGSLEMFFAVTTFRSFIHALYEPVTRSIVPGLLVVGGSNADGEDLKRVSTLGSMAWSSLMIVGGVAGGWASHTIGLQACYAVDSASYLLSTIIMYNVSGTYTAIPKIIPTISNAPSPQQQQQPPSSSTTTTKKRTLHQKIRATFHRTTILPLLESYHLLANLLTYLCSSSIGLLLFLKASGALTWGTQEILNPTLALIPNDEEATANRIGVLYTFVGLGCLIGPLFVNGCVLQGVGGREGVGRMQAVVIGCLAVVAFGWWGVAQVHGGGGFGWVCFFTMVRSAGMSVIWVDSTLLLQSLTPGHMLGRVMGLDYSFAALAEAGAAITAGNMVDNGYSMPSIARISGSVGMLMFVLWSIYHVFGGGAAHRKFKYGDGDGSGGDDIHGVIVTHELRDKEIV